MTKEVLQGMLEEVVRYQDRIDRDKIMPRVRWK